MLNSNFAIAQDQATRDAISQQVRDQINAARLQAQDAANNARIAARAGTPANPGEAVTIQQIPWNPNDDIPPRAANLGIAFLVMAAFVVIFLPMSRAIARRSDRQSSTAKIPPEVTAQLAQLSQAVDAIALEVERISEGQRFTTRLLSEQRAEQSKTLLAQPAGERPPNG